MTTETEKTYKCIMVKTFPVTSQETKITYNPGACNVCEQDFRNYKHIFAEVHDATKKETIPAVPISIVADISTNKVEDILNADSKVEDTTGTNNEIEDKISTDIKEENKYPTLNAEF